MFIQNLLDKIENFFTRLIGRSTGREILRAVLLLALSLFALIPMWKASEVVLYAIGVLSLVLLVGHWSRKILFPYIDMQQVYLRAIQTYQGATVVFVSLLLLMVCVGYLILCLIK